MARTKKVEPILENNIIQQIDVIDETNNVNQSNNDNQSNNVDTIVTKSKRGRKPKNPLLKMNESPVENIIVSHCITQLDKTENIILSNSEELNLNFETNEIVKDATNEK